LFLYLLSERIVLVNFTCALIFLEFLEHGNDFTIGYTKQLRSQSKNRGSFALGCSGTGDSHHVCAAGKV